MTEHQPFEILKEFDGFELRRYPDYVLAEVEIRGDFVTSGNSAFQPLLRYITGANAKQLQMQMTAPVLQTETEPDRHLVSFVLPNGITGATAPMPIDEKVRVVPVAGHLAVARKFTGSWNFDRFLKESDALSTIAEDAISKGQLSGKLLGEPYFARYNSPFSLPIFRHNEVLMGFEAS